MDCWPISSFCRCSSARELCFRAAGYPLFWSRCGNHLTLRVSLLHMIDVFRMIPVVLPGKHHKLLLWCFRECLWVKTLKLEVSQSLELFRSWLRVGWVNCVRHCLHCGSLLGCFCTVRFWCLRCVGFGYGSEHYFGACHDNLLVVVFSPTKSFFCRLMADCNLCSYNNRHVLWIHLVISIVLHDLSWRNNDLSLWPMCVCLRS